MNVNKFFFIIRDNNLRFRVHKVNFFYLFIILFEIMSMLRVCLKVRYLIDQHLQSEELRMVTVNDILLTAIDQTESKKKPRLMSQSAMPPSVNCKFTRPIIVLPAARPHMIIVVTELQWIRMIFHFPSFLSTC